VKTTNTLLPVDKPCPAETVMVQVVVDVVYVPLTLTLLAKATLAGVPEVVFDTTAPLRRVRLPKTNPEVPTIICVDFTSVCIMIKSP
jgi:hypothetical protein